MSPDQQYREQQRRDWAALQKPELVTTKQAIAMLDRTFLGSFRKYLLSYGIVAHRSNEFKGAYFYERAAVEELAIKHAKGAVVPQRQGRTPIGETVAAKITKIPEIDWSREDFVRAWVNDKERAKVEDIVDRAPSITKFTSFQAYDFIKTILNLNSAIPHHIQGHRYDIQFFRKSIYSYVMSQQLLGRKISQHDVNYVRDFMLGFHTNTDIGALDPDIVVAIIFELRLSRKQK